VLDEFRANERVVLFDYANTFASFSILHQRQLPPATATQLLVSSSTFATAVHLAAYMGARRIYLVGHDCGTLDGETNFVDYHDEATLAMAWNKTGQNGTSRKEEMTNAYRTWLSGGWERINIENDTIVLKALLRERYGVSVHSISPFINFGLEGHRYRAGRA